MDILSIFSFNKLRRASCTPTWLQILVAVRKMSKISLSLDTRLLSAEGSFLSLTLVTHILFIFKTKEGFLISLIMSSLTYVATGLLEKYLPVEIRS